MKFKILHLSESEKMFAGQIIRYKINVFPLITVNWVTEITHMNEPFYFADEQRFGPFALWHHKHHFKEVNGGVEMTDEVDYAIPLGAIGRVANWLFVGRQVDAIFNYRFEILQKLFTTKPDTY